MTCTTPEIALIASLTRLVDVESAFTDTSYSSFAMNLSLAIACDSTAPPPAIPLEVLQPWQWSRITQVQLAVSNDQSTFQSLTPSANVVIYPDPGQPPAFPQRTSLIGELVKLQQVSNYCWQSPACASFQRKAAMDFNGKQPWHAVLLDFSRYPYPIPQSLNLAFILRIKTADLQGKKYLCAAPVLTGIAGGPYGQCNPQNTPAAIAAVPGAFSWSYSCTPPVGGLPFTMYSQACEITPKAVGSPVLPVTKVYADDWRANLESRLAQMFDLSDHLIRILRYNVDSSSIPAGITVPTITGGDGLWQFVDVVIATLRDLAGTGLLVDPSGSSLIGSLLRDKNVNPPDLFSGPNGLAEWKAFLVGTFPAFGSYTILNRANVSSGFTPVQALAELESLQKFLADRENLYSLVLAQWGLTTISPDNLTQLKGAVTRDFPFRERLSLCNIGDVWQKLQTASLTKGLYEVLNDTTAGQDIGSRLETAFRARIDSTTPSRFPKVGVVPSSNAIASYLNTWGNLKSKLSVIPPDSTTDDRTTPQAHPLSLQVSANVSAPRADTQEDSNDPLRSMSGVVTIMRESGKDWRCLNYASAQVVDGSGAAVHVLAPSRLVYRNGFAETVLNYNNQPVIARSPLAGVSTPEINWTGTGNSARKGIIYYDSIEATTAAAIQKRKIPGLRFGSKYKAAALVISNAGTLPGDYCLANDPWNIDFSKLGNLSSTVPLNGAAEVDYLRRVPIGPIRVCSALTKDDKGNILCSPNTAQMFPPIPAGVFPRAAEVPSKLLVNTSARLRDGSNPQSVETAAQKIPLLLLDNNSSRSQDRQFTFALRVPAVDLETWDRMQLPDKSGEFTKARLRTGARADYLDKLTQSRQDTSIDDPALGDNPAFEVWLQRYDDQGNPEVDGSGKPVVIERQASLKGAEPYVDPAPTSSDLGNTTATLENVRAFPLIVTVAIGAEGSKCTLDTTNPGLCLITIPPGQLARVIFACRVEKAAKQLFHPAVRQVTRGSSGEVSFVNPLQIHIETTTDSLIPGKAGKDAADAILKQFRVEFQPSQNDLDQVVAKVAFPNDGSFRYLRRVQLIRQQWYWQGRPCDPNNPVPPASLTQDSPGDAWDEYHFASRSDDAFRMIEMNYDINQTGFGFSYREPLVALQNHGTTSKDLRSRYYRFALIAWSRYTPLLPESRASQRAPQDQAAWRRLSVPCRSTELSAPKIRMVFPLTESATRNENTIPTSGGLLVVLDEGWFEVAGLGEYLEAEVTTSEIKNIQCKPGGPVPSPADAKYWDLGADPIHFAIKASGAGYSTDAYQVLFKSIQGPVGHTHDMTDDGALFTSSSFLLHLPEITDKNGAQIPFDGSWTMARVRFRRAVKERKGNALVTTVAGAWTKPQWVQFIPAFSLETTSISAAVILSDGNLEMKWKSKRTKNTGPEIYRLVILTRDVYDVMGKLNQQAFAGMYLEDATGKWRLLQKIDQPHKGTLRARICEIEAQPHYCGDRLPSKPEDLFSALFEPGTCPNEAGNDWLRSVDLHAMRIVTMSRPFPVEVK